MQGMILISSACKPKTVVSMALRSPRTSPGLFVHPTSGISSLQSATEVILVFVCKSNGQLLSSECCTLCHLSYRCYRYCFRLCSALLATIVSAAKIQVTVLSIVNRQLGVQELACCTCPIAVHYFLSSIRVETPFALLPRMQAQCSSVRLTVKDCEGIACASLFSCLLVCPFTSSGYPEWLLE